MQFIVTRLFMQRNERLLFNGKITAVGIRDTVILLSAKRNMYELSSPVSVSRYKCSGDLAYVTTRRSFR